MWVQTLLIESDLGPQLGPILRLHRHLDGYVIFLLGSDDTLAPAVAIRARDLETYFPEWQERFMKDAYCSINGSWRLLKHGRHGGAYGYPKHDTASLRYLCANYADIDCHKLGIDFWDAVERVGVHVEAGKIPPISIIVRSGRGAWLLWLLREASDPLLAQRAWPEKLDLYSQIQRAIYERLADIGADPAGTDSTRHIRVPGSLHTGSERLVTWHIQSNGTGDFVYTIQDMAQFFGVKGRELEKWSQNAFDRQRNPNKKKGWLALNDYRLRDFERLRSLRGGFNKGHRNSAVLVYAWLLMHQGVNRSEAHEAVLKLARESRPPLSLRECKTAVNSVFGRKIRFSEQNIADRLDITPAEFAHLEQYNPATRFHHKRVPPGAPPRPKAPNAEVRRAAILAIVNGRGGQVPPCRMMAELLKEQGFQVAYVQVSKDYRVLELKTERIHQWAAKATAQGKMADLFSEVAYMEETASPPVSLNGRALQVLSFG
jgi:hypothetical protein